VNSGSSAGGLGSTSAARQLDRDDSAQAEGGEQAAALWVALAQQVTGAQSLPVVADASVSPPPNAWRPSAGDMTPATGLAPSSSDAQTETKAPERMTLRLDGGALGELEVTLERQEGGMRVVIGMENQAQIGAVLPDARALQSALESAGIHVQSLNVVPQSEVGTVLAQRRLSPSGQKSDADTGPEQDREKAQKRTSKRLTLIG
jgi:flagellar hook-length control protein FliK